MFGNLTFLCDFVYYWDSYLLNIIIFHHILPVIYIGKLYKKDPQQHPELKRYLVFLLEKHVSHIDLLSKLKL